uniref:Uncharacterized protein n=1 Tax=Anguilla anguilla TaxID=7936 RepID=A0A0E9RWR1_ANGAN
MIQNNIYFFWLLSCLGSFFLMFCILNNISHTGFHT